MFHVVGQISLFLLSFVQYHHILMEYEDLSPISSFTWQGLESGPLSSKTNNLFLQTSVSILIAIFLISSVNTAYWGMPILLGYC